jgi:hypothetical protein
MIRVERGKNKLIGIIEEIYKIQTHSNPLLRFNVFSFRFTSTKLSKEFLKSLRYFNNNGARFNYSDSGGRPSG